MLRYFRSAFLRPACPARLSQQLKDRHSASLGPALSGPCRLLVVTVPCRPALSEGPSQGQATGRSSLPPWGTSWAAWHLRTPTWARGLGCGGPRDPEEVPRLVMGD